MIYRIVFKLGVPLLAISTAVVALGGCALNAVHTVPEGNSVSLPTQSAMLLYGVGMEVPPPSPLTGFSVKLDRYSPETRRITANCFRYDHTRAALPRTYKGIRYFLFRVPAGHYALSGGSLFRPKEPSYVYFAAPEGRITYVGDFVHVGDHRIEVRHDVPAAKTALAARWSYTGDFLVADAKPTGFPGFILCMP